MISGTIRFAPLLLTGRLLLTLFLLPSCAFLANPTFVSPSQGGAAWVAVETDHFLLRTDLDQDDALQVSRQFEEIHDAFEKVAFPNLPLPPTRFELVLFSRHDEFKELAPNHFGAYFTPARSTEFEGRPVMVAPGGFNEWMRQTFQHELTHRFVAAHYPNAPIWLNEGLAEYFAVLKFDKGEATLGWDACCVAFSSNSWMRRHDGGVGARGANIIVVRREVPRSAVPKVAELRALSQRAFYETDHSLADDEEVARLRTRSTRYGGAWALVHTLRHSYEKEFGRYLKLLGSGRLQAKAAWSKAFGRIGDGAIESSFQATLKPHRTKTATLAYKELKDLKPRLRKMSASEVHTLWAKTRQWDQPEKRARARQDIEVALKLDPKHTEALLTKARLLLVEGREPRAVKALDKALQLKPKSSRVLYAIVKTLAGIEENKAHAERDWTRINELVERLRKRANSAQQWHLLALVDLSHKRYDAAAELAEGAVKAEPSCWRCWKTLAQADFATGRKRKAIRDLENAIGVMPHDAYDYDSYRLLEEFKHAATADST